ncbi:insulinase family protein [Roseateles sp. DAIF2]|uniref:M16 family metallopeptidase n=1 Tax=Roseateles sp. DAIF2 TaxID=2714952 RepID=UPI0018A30EC7|nr:pitrilysin family protein [Roseateles sp. DAIF2]QPF71873.1 insulinase family protein [Roseateles sp. DAIF2]
MRRRQLLWGAALAWPAWAQQRFDQAPAPSRPRAPRPPPLSELRLDNGLRVLLAERRGWPLVTAQLQLNLGSLLDPAGKAGLAQLFLDVMTRGAQRGGGGNKGLAADGGDIAFAAESLGASLESQTLAQAATLGLTLATPSLDEGLALLADLARRPTLPASELERSRAQAIDGYRQTLADPAALAQLLGRRLFWGDSAAGQQPTPASLARIRRDDLLNVLRLQLRPELSTLILGGDLDAAQARALAERHFGGWRAPPRVPALLPAPVRARPLAARTLLVDVPGAGQSAVLVLGPHAGLEAGARELGAGLLANAVLGQGYSARLGREVRIKRGLSYGAASQVESLAGGGWMAAYTQTKHDSASEVAKLIAAEIQRLGVEPLGAAELEARRASWLGEQGRRLETSAGLAGLLSEQLLQSREPAALTRLPQELQAVDAAALRAFAARYWRADALRTVVVGDLGAAGPGLRALDPGAWVIRAAELDLASPTLQRRARGR